MSNRPEIRLAYHGESADSGEMDVRVLAPALISFADLMDFSHREITGDNKQQLNVVLKSDIRHGSFEIELLVEIAELIESSEPYIQDAWRLIDEYGTTVLRTIRAIRRMVTEIKSREGEGRGEDRSESQLIDRLCTRPRIMRSLLRFAESTEAKGIRGVVIMDADGHVSIYREDVPHLRRLVGRTIVLGETVTKEVVEVRTLRFKRGDRWRVGLRGRSVPVRILDHDFIDRVQKRQIVFMHGDRFYVTLRTKAKLVGVRKVKRYEYDIQVVHKKIEGSTDTAFPSHEGLD